MKIEFNKCAYKPFKDLSIGDVFRENNCEDMILMKIEPCRAYDDTERNCVDLSDGELLYVSEGSYTIVEHSVKVVVE